MAEGRSGDTLFSFVVALSAASGQSASVSFPTTDGGPTTGDRVCNSLLISADFLIFVRIPHSTPRTSIRAAN